MSEIEKMYENAGIEKSCNSDLEFCPVEFCDECNLNIYPELTAEKQIELICFLLNANIKIDICKEPNMKMEICDIAEALAEVTNTIWQDLTEEEKQQIKEILNG